MMTKSKTTVELTTEELKLLQKMRENEEEENKGEKSNSKNPPFVQVYKGVGFKALQWLSAKNPVGSSIMMFFLDNMNNNNIVMVSQSLLAETLGKGRTTIYNSIKFLDEHNFIEIAKVGTANAYIINPDIAFQDSHAKKKYINFQGNILVSESENKELFKKHKHKNIKLMNEE